MVNPSMHLLREFFYKKYFIEIVVVVAFKSEIIDYITYYYMASVSPLVLTILSILGVLPQNVVTAELVVKSYHFAKIG